MEPIFVCLNYRSPIGSIGGMLSTYDPAALAVNLLDNLSKVDDLFDVADADHYLLGSAVDSNFGANLINRIVHHSVLRDDIQRTRIKQGAISGLKLIGTAIELLQNDTNVALCQAVENMSSIPDYVPNARIRKGAVLTDAVTVNGVLRDAYYLSEQQAVTALVADSLVTDNGLTKADLDDYVWLSYQRYLNALKENHYRNEIAPIHLSSNPGQSRRIEVDEEAARFRTQEPIVASKPVFGGELTTASIARSGDGSSILVVADQKGLRRTGLLPQARILKYMEHFCESSDYIRVSVQAIRSILSVAKLEVEDVNIWEINEDTAFTPLAISRNLGIDIGTVNTRGGSLAIANPLSVSGLRLVTSACNQLASGQGDYAIVQISDPSGSIATVLLERA